jgi:signal transduction histidine kinase
VGASSPVRLVAARFLFPALRGRASPPPALTVFQPLSWSLAAGFPAAASNGLGGPLRTSDLYFLKAPVQERTTILRRYLTQVEAFRMRPAIETSLRHAKEQAERAAKSSAEAMEKAVAANRAKSEFLANMSHELRTPLNAIIGFSEIICEQSLGEIKPPKYVEYANDIRNSGQHLLAVINDVLDLAKVEFGKATLVEEHSDVSELLEGCIRIIQSRAIQENVELASEFAAGRPLLYADSRKVKQILLNLLSNAVKFTPAGGRIVLRSERIADGGIKLIVEDNGIGIAFEDIKKALAPFSQVDTRLNRKFEGTGLGLPLSKGMAELHQGSLEVSSRLGAGTTVAVKFPAERVEWRDE